MIGNRVAIGANGHLILTVLAAVIGSLLLGVAISTPSSAWRYSILGASLLLVMFLVAIRTPHRAFFFFLLFIPINVFLIRFNEVTIGPYLLLGGIKDALLLLLTFAILSSYLLKRQDLVPRGALSYLILLFIFWVGFQSLRNSIYVGVISLRIIALFVLVYLAVKLTVNTLAKARDLLLAIVLGGLFALLVSFMELQSFSWTNLGNIGGRLAGVFPQVNMQGAYLGILFIAGLLFFIRVQRTSSQIAVIAYEITVLFFLVLTFSRRSWFGVLGGILVWGIVRLKSKKEIFRLFLLLLVLSAGSLVFVNRISEKESVMTAAIDRIAFINNDPESYVGVSYRIDQSRYLWNQITHDSASFIFGKGLGTVGTGLLSVSEDAITFHNSYFAMWFETGLVGLTIFLSCILVAMYQGIRVARSDSEWSSIASVSLACVSLILISALFGDMLGNYPFNFFLWFFIGLLSVAHSSFTEASNAHKDTVC